VQRDGETVSWSAAVGRMRPSFSDDSWNEQEDVTESINEIRGRKVVCGGEEGRCPCRLGHVPPLFISSVHLPTIAFPLRPAPNETD